MNIHSPLRVQTVKAFRVCYIRIAITLQPTAWSNRNILVHITGHHILLFASSYISLINFIYLLSVLGSYVFRAVRFEPGTAGYKARALPLSYTVPYTLEACIEMYSITFRSIYLLQVKQSDLIRVEQCG